MSPLSPRRSPPVSDVLVIALAGLVLFGAGLGARDLWNPNEPAYGRAAVEMEERGAWLVPTVNGVDFAEKPPLWFWAARVAGLATGRLDERALRLPNLLAAVCALLADPAGAARMGERAAAKVRERLSLEAQVERLEEVYRGVFREVSARGRRQWATA